MEMNETVSKQRFSISYLLPVIEGGASRGLVARLLTIQPQIFTSK